jgi:hypothetical protein
MTLLSFHSILISPARLLLIVNICFASVAKAQTHLFSEEALDRGIIMISDHNNWGNGLSFHDWDRDGWPDLTFCRSGLPPVFYHNDGGTFSPVAFNIPNTHEAKMVLWVDYDNDGDADLFITRFLGPWSLYRNNGNFMFTDVSEEAGITQVEGFAWTMGASWGDINNDGHLDLYICTYHLNDIRENLMFRANGDGTFTDVSEETGTSDGSKPSFQSVFADFNMDGWPDLHVSNDRFCCANSLYLNDGDGLFTDISASSGIDFNIDAMSNTVADFDNDGDLDIYVSNHVAGNILLRNNGDITFTAVADEAGVAVNQVSWAALFLDQDLDGWQDLFVCTSPLSANNTVVHNYFFTNNADGTFEYRNDSGMEAFITRSYCAATADFDNDGAPDIAIANKHPHVAELWRNNAENHSFLKVSLQGTESNRDGIGATVRCYVNGAMQLRHTQCGHAHFGQDSQYLIFGLNGATSVDSLSVTWPGGAVDMRYGIAAGQTLHVTEGDPQILVSIPQQTSRRAPFTLVGSELIFAAGRKIEVVVMDMQGRQVVSADSGMVNRCDLSLLPSGLYVTRWQDAEGAWGAERIFLP